MASLPEIYAAALLRARYGNAILWHEERRMNSHTVLLFNCRQRSPRFPSVSEAGRAIKSSYLFSTFCEENWYFGEGVHSMNPIAISPNKPTWFSARW